MKGSNKVVKSIACLIGVILLIAILGIIVLIKFNNNHNEIALMTNKNLDRKEYCSNDFCFVKGTKVITPKGFINIEDLKEGDTVFSRNQETESIELKKVLQVYESNYEFDTLKIYTSTANVEATLNHKFYEKNRGWIEAENLMEGDTLINSSDEELEILKIERIKSEEIQPVYNLEIEDNHNYFVGLDSILVHNRCCVTGDTLVLTSISGDVKPIKDIKLGEQVVTYNRDTNQKEVKNVITTTIKNQVTEIAIVTFDDGTQITQNLYHEMYTEQGLKSPVNLNKYMELSKGDRVLTENGLKTVEKVEIDLKHEPIDLYTLDNDDNHNFYANGTLMKGY